MGRSQNQQDMEDEEQRQLEEGEEDMMYGDEGDAQGVYPVNEEQDERDEESNGQEDLEEEMNDQVYDDQNHNQNLQAIEPNAPNASEIKAAGAGEVEEEEDFGLKFPKEYHGKTLANSKVVD